MKDGFYKTGGRPNGFSLAEVLAALTIGAMILVAVLSIYSRAQRSADAVMNVLDSSQLGPAVLQRIAEDIDRIVSSGADTKKHDTKITVENKLDNLYQTARLVILKTVYNSKNKKQTFEKVVWQASYDYESDTEGLVLYRSYSGMCLEDKLLDGRRADWEKGFPFVPICTGITAFKVQIPKKLQIPRNERRQNREREQEWEEQQLLDEWKSESLPKTLVVTVSFAEPFKTVEGILDVTDEEKVARTITVDKTRKVSFVFIEPEEEDFDRDEKDEEQVEDEDRDEGREQDKKSDKEQDDEK